MRPRFLPNPPADARDRLLSLLAGCLAVLNLVTTIPPSPTLAEAPHPTLATGDHPIAANPRSNPSPAAVLTTGLGEIRWVSPDAAGTQATAWGDVDGDGDLDIVVGNNGVNQLYFNDGVGDFTVQDIGIDGWNTTAVALGDMEGDGDLDLALAGYDGFDGISRVWANDGHGTFTQVWTGTGDQPTSVAWGDADNDGDLDLAVGNDGRNQLYRNDGTGQFLQIWTDGEENIYTTSVAWGDADGDGTLELVAANYYYRGIFATPWPDQVYDFEFDASPDPDPQLLNTTISDIGGMEHTTSLALGDVDGDGDLDVLTGNEGGSYVYANDGDGGFAEVWQAPVDPTQTTSVALGDVDVDGDLDLVLGKYGTGNRIYTNEGGWMFTLSWESTSDYEATENVTLGDCDGDGDLDLAVGNDDQVNLIHENEGSSGMLLNASIGDDDARDTRSVALADIDDDGDLDFAVANWGYANQIYRNDGTGHFSHEPIDGRMEESTSVAWGDMDGDGDLDLAVGNSFQPNRIYRNDGTGHFLPVWASPDTASSSSVVWGDMDGDGDLDLAVGNYKRLYPDSVYYSSDCNQFYRNNGDGTFSVAAVSICYRNTSSLAWGDLDEDGDLDLAVGNYYVMVSDATPVGEQNQVYWNDGSGGFSVVDIDDNGNMQYTHSIALADVDGNGWLDIAAGNVGVFWEDQSEAIYLNTGGTFTKQNVGWGSAYGLAWANIDSDTVPDLVVGYEDQQNRIYYTSLNASPPPTLTFTIEDLTPDNRATRSLAVGDIDNDGDNDVIVGNRSNQLNQIYRNDGGGTFGAEDIGAPGRQTRAIAWGDADGDGDLDLAAAISGPGAYQADHLYRNDGGIFTIEALPILSDTTSLAWGDADGDDDLDLVTGNDGQADQVLLNDGSGTFTPGWASTAISATRHVAWGDADGDGDLDWIAGNANQPNRLYLNQGGLQGGAAGTFASGWTSPDARATRHVSWGDVDGDGDLDLAVANEGQPNQLFLNNGAGSFSLAWGSADARATRAVAWGDTDGDGDLDLLAGNYEDVNQVYENQGGTLAPSPVWESPLGEMRRTTSLAVRDVNGDGRLDVVLGNDGQPNQVYVNSGNHTFSIRDIGTDTYATQAVALGDADGDGDLDLAVANSGQVDQVYENVWTGRSLHPNNPPRLRILGPANALQADLYATAGVLSDSLIPITYQLVDNESDRVGRVEAFYSTDGGGRWRPAVEASPTVTSHLAADPLGVSHVYTWDTFASGFFGQSDNVVLRLLAYPQPASSAINGTYVYSGTAPAPHHPFAAVTTFPFRARGTQVQVYSGTAEIGHEASGALVYRLPAGESTGGALLADAAGRPFRTDGNGYLQGRGTLGISDTLFAMLPVTHTGAYTLYYTSGAVTETGVLGRHVADPGVQDLVVSPDHPLILFNLDLSLEWDAHNDGSYLEQLRFNLQQVSQYLYDFTDGQIALGDVNVFQNADEWAYAHVVVNANNRLRPFAAQGGIVLSETIDPEHNVPSDTIVYAPGQVAMGSTWNRYGTPGQSLGEDWPIILAHELSHYLLFQDDTYIGMDENGYLVAVDSCYGSAMGDLYSNPDNTEFVADDAHWSAGCANTLAHQTLGRDEWETIELWYPDLVPPSRTNPGPSLMPFDLTSVQIHDPYTPTNTLLDPSFYIDYDGGGSASSEARAYLLRDEYVFNLGSPFGGQDRVIARGARPGDRICVFDRSRSQYGCETIALGDDRLAMEQDTSWNPILQVSPVNSTTIVINVTTPVSVSNLRARIFPDLGRGEDPIDLAWHDGVYSGTFRLAWPAMSGNVQIWVDEAYSEADPRREAMVAYAIGGNPGTLRAGGGTLRAGGGTLRAGGGTLRAGGGTLRAGGAPIVSPDGQMIFFTENPVDFEPGTFFTVQAMAGLPPLPAGRTLVGQGYNLVASPGVTLPQGSVSVQYLPNDVLVAGANEGDLELYYWDPLAGWEPLPTVLDPYYNLASAPSQGEGFYALLASVRIPLSGPGWNNFAYPIEGTRPVTEALLSISSLYTTVYHYDATDVTDPWAVHDVTVPEWVNDLDRLTFGQGYWINVSESIVLYLAPDAAESTTRSAPPPVPATFYGGILPATSFEPAAGMTITAGVGGAICAQGVVTDVTGFGLAYVIDVPPGCGVPGEKITFYVDGQPMAPQVAWSNDRLWRVDLTLGRHRRYLPLVTNRAVTAPDLVVETIVATPDGVDVTIRNQGNASSPADGFWVDAYIDPDPVPTGVNQTWGDLADQGIVWGVESSLAPGEAMTLTVGGALYHAGYSDVSWPLALGTPVYAQVDSAHVDTAYGAVLELDEILGQAYNNISSTTVVTRR